MLVRGFPRIDKLSVRGTFPDDPGIYQPVINHDLRLF